MVWASRLPLGKPNLSTLSAAMIASLASVSSRAVVDGVVKSGEKSRASVRGLRDFFGLRLMAIAGSVFGWIDPPRIDRLPGAVTPYAKEARLETFVARGAVAVLLDREQDRVVVTVDSNLMYGLEVSRFFALAPQTIARAREIAGVARPQSFLEGLAVHVGDHQKASALIVLGDDRNDTAALVEVDLRSGRLRCWLGFHLRAPASYAGKLLQ